MRRRALLPILGTPLLGLGVAAASFANGCGQEQQPPAKERATLEAPSWVAADRGAGADRAELGAEIVGVDLARGRALVFIDGEERLLRGTPTQLVGLAPGDAVNLRVRAYGAETWLWPPTGGGDVSRFSTWGSLTGPVEGVDPLGGALFVGGQRLLAHPDDVASVLPGERITLRFARVGEVWWALELDGETASPRAHATSQQSDT